jgi:quinoprotein glucose dehydrogenase
LPKVGEATLPVIRLQKRGGALHALAKVVGVVVALLSAPSGLRAQTIPGALPESTAALAKGEWPAYAGTYASARYSPLTQIDRDNAKNLHVAWRWKSPDQAIKDADPRVGPSNTNESTPLMVGGTLYTSTSLSEVAAIDAVSGETKWVFDPKVYQNGLGLPANLGWLHRGVAYWRSGDDERIVILTAFAQMIALDAKTGKPVATFGTDGRVDLAQGLRRPVDRDYYTMTSPPVIVRGVIVVGSSVMDWWGHRPSPPGDVRGFDATSGKLLWTFHTVAQGEEPGAETWANESWKETGNANVWAPISADEELGYIYLPVSTPTNDYYGGHRPGDGLYGESLVCLDVATGKKVWHYQLVHHGLWDYDPPAAPNLIDITVDGKRIKAVAQVTKQAFIYVFDRLTGQPVWPIEEQPVPASSVPGEQASKTQPFPTKPAAFDIQGARDENLIDLSPEIHKEAIDIAAAYDRGELFTPPTLRGHHPGARCRWRRQLERRCGRSRNRYALRQHLSLALRGCRAQAAAVRIVLRFHRPAQLFAGAARATVAQTAVRKRGRDRHEQRRAALAHSGRARRADPCHQTTRHSRTVGVSLAELDAGDQDRHDRGAEGLPGPGPFRAGPQFTDPRPVQFRSASVGL